MQRIIEIPTGTRFVLAAQIPGWIAERLVPVPDTPPVLVSLQKKIPQAEPNHYRIEDLTEADVSLLEQIWAGMSADSPLELMRGHAAAESLTREHFAPYQEAFDAAPNRPEWLLQGNFLDVRGEAMSRRSEIRMKHWDELESRARAGRLTILSNYGTPTKKIEIGAQVSIEDARDYLAQVPPGFELREESHAQPDSNAQSASKPLSRHRHQESEILRVIRELGHDPLKLPPQAKGKRWIAAEVRDRLTGGGWSKSIHEKAWARLRENGEIKEG